MTPSLSGPRAKVAVAKEDINALQRETQVFFNRYIGRARVGKRQAKTGWYPLQPDEAVDLPVDWAVRIGEVAYDLRSALDGLVCQLAILTDPNRRHVFCKERRTSFPICIYGPRSSRKGALRFLRSRLSYLKPVYVTRIEGFQPYKRGNRKRLSPLWLLREINDTDKHNLIVLIDRWTLDLRSQRMRELAIFTDAARIPFIFETPRKQPAGQVHMNREPSHQVAFGDWCDAVKGFPVVRTLRRIADSVDYIIESFSDDFP